MSGLDISSPFLSLPDSICISSVRPTTTEVVVSIASTKTSALCPRCGARSERIHGQYGRTVADLPCSGRRVILALTVRKFVCTHSSCTQRIFTERLAELVQSYARMTNRLRDALVALGLATSAQVSERVAPELAIHVSAPTLLRRLREVACPPPASVRILGVDDWSWKKGQTYGTLLVDLELGRPIELLPDRREETLTAWLLTHPEVEVISRDRGGEYAAAARKGAPQAQQIADRFHLLLNLREKLKELMARKQKLLPHVEIPLSKNKTCKGRAEPRGCASSSVSGPVEEAKSFRHMSPYPRMTPSGAVPIPPEETPSQVSRSNRYARYEAEPAPFWTLLANSSRRLAEPLKSRNAGGSERVAIKPINKANQIDRGCDGQVLQMRFSLSNITGTAQVKGTHPL